MKSNRNHGRDHRLPGVILSCLSIAALVLPCFLVQAAEISISGTVALPSGTAPAGGISVQISAQQVTSKPYWVPGAQCWLTIPEGRRSTAYSLTVEDGADLAWRVEYFHDMHRYVEKGYYTASGTTWNRHDAAQLAGGQDHTGIDLTLLVGNTISGTVRLVSGTAPAGGISPTINIDNIQGEPWEGCVTFASLEQGESSVPFSVVVPIDTTASWRIEYWCWQGQCEHGFYSDKGLGQDPSRATLLAGGRDHTGIQLILDRRRFPWSQFLPIILERKKRSR